MSIVGIVSMKGGVGKTSTCANLATGLAALLGQNRVSVVDLDPQNGLHWHFGLEALPEQGVCVQSLENDSWRDIAFPSEYGVACLPYGMVSEPQREAFEDLLVDDPNWLGHQLKQAGLDEDAVVLIDTPPGPSVYLKQVFACADLILVVLLADAGSYATIPSMESWIEDAALRSQTLRIVYVLNQVNREDALNRDVADALRVHLGPRLAPIGIHADEGVCEALAFQQPVLVYDPHGQASHDLAKLASWVIDTLNQ